LSFVRIHRDGSSRSIKPAIDVFVFQEIADFAQTALLKSRPVDLPQEKGAAYFPGDDACSVFLPAGRSRSRRSLGRPPLTLLKGSPRSNSGTRASFFVSSFLFGRQKRISFQAQVSLGHPNLHPLPLLFWF
jgi:hypothetical protein